MGKTIDVKVYYEAEEVGDYYADLVVNGVVIIELKAAKAVCEEHEAQLLNYLKATGLKRGLLINFGAPSLQYKRLVWGYEDRKKSA